MNSLSLNCSLFPVPLLHQHRFPCDSLSLRFQATEVYSAGTGISIIIFSIPYNAMLPQWHILIDQLCYFLPFDIIYRQAHMRAYRNMKTYRRTRIERIG